MSRPYAGPHDADPHRATTHDAAPHISITVNLTATVVRALCESFRQEVGQK
jgi:hypothetical protein